MYRIGGKQGMNYLENYYANYDEEGRLASKHGQVEFLTTMKYIHKFISGTEKKKILEAGAGTGRYSIVLAREGHEGGCTGIYCAQFGNYEFEAAFRLLKLSIVMAHT